jgi:hypothetical protein
MLYSFSLSRLCRVAFGYKVSTNSFDIKQALLATIVIYTPTLQCIAAFGLGEIQLRSSSLSTHGWLISTALHFSDFSLKICISKMPSATKEWLCVYHTFFFC